MSFTIQDFFMRGLKREIPDLLEDGEKQLELGPGVSPIPGCYYLDLDWDDSDLNGEMWNADVDTIPFADGSIDTIHAMSILEHVEDPINLLKECQRVLKVGGHINIVVPHYTSECAFRDLDHKWQFSESTWKNTFDNKWYKKGKEGWQFEIHANFLMGILQRHNCIFTQLIKVEK